MNKQAPYSIYIYNPIEDEWPFISSFPKKNWNTLITSSNRFADCYLYANAHIPQFTLISPIPIDGEVKEYFEELSDCKSTIIIPRTKTPFICKNITADTDVFNFLISEAKKASHMDIYAYAITQHVYDLKRHFEKKGILVRIPEAPDEKNAWTIQHFGQKSGFRKSFFPLMAKGAIFPNASVAKKNAITMFQESAHGIVLKTDKGNAGQGVHILRKNEINSEKKLKEKLLIIFQNEPFLKKHPIIIEEYIDTSKEKMCPFPSVEVFIHQNGKIEIPYYCNMIVKPEGEFYGMEMHESVLKGAILKKVMQITKSIAQTYKQAGYRGRFDIDMLCDGKNVYARESNTRINGGTDTYLIVKKLIGNDFFSRRYVISSYLDLPSGLPFTIQTVKRLLSQHFFNKVSKTGVIIGSISTIKNGGLTYTVIEKTKKSAYEKVDVIVSLLTNNKNKE